MCHITFLAEEDMSFTPPVKLIKFLIEHSIDLDSILGMPIFEGVNMDLIGDVLSAAQIFHRTNGHL